ncbi:MAG: hypothetical protein AABW90_03155 [Nanoarchaeota archaeon]
MDNNEELILQILNQVKQNRKYSSISNDIVKDEIKTYLKSHQINPNPKKYKIKKIVKEIRARLHRLYSSYQIRKKNKRDFYLEELKNIINKENKQVERKQVEQEFSSHFLHHNKILEITNKLLSTNISTKERLNDYQYIYNDIFKITGKPKAIVDLGAGLNPLSFPFTDLKKLTYYAYDIDINDINFLNNYFKIMKFFGLNGKAEILDVRGLIEVDKLNQLPNSDIIFMFKLIDLIDTKNKRKKKISEVIITNLLKNKKTKFIVASFSTKTLSQKSMKLPIRRGFELMLLRNNLKFKIFSTSNEVFYVVSDNNF